MQEFDSFCPTCGVALENAKDRKCKVCGADVQAARSREVAREAAFERGAVEEAATAAPTAPGGYTSDATEIASEVPFALSVIDREGLSAIPEKPPEHPSEGQVVRGYTAPGASANIGHIFLNWRRAGWVFDDHDPIDDDVWIISMRYDPDEVAANARRARMIALAVAASVLIAMAGIALAAYVGSGA